jgi:hypothetical protein
MGIRRLRCRCHFHNPNTLVQTQPSIFVQDLVTAPLSLPD